MAHDISGAILSHVSNFAVGLVATEAGKGSKVLGSGVLVSIEGRRGILTCGHVAETYEKRPAIGLIRFVAGGEQRHMLKLDDTQTIIIQSSDTFEEKKEVMDLAFTLLIGSIFVMRSMFPKVIFEIGTSRRRSESAKLWRTTVGSILILGIVVTVIGGLIVEKLK